MSSALPYLLIKLIYSNTRKIEKKTESFSIWQATNFQVLDESIETKVNAYAMKESLIERRWEENFQVENKINNIWSLLIRTLENIL